MKRQEFLKSLYQELAPIPDRDRQKIISDYEQHFERGREEGQTEADMAAALESPKSIARFYKADYMLKKAEQESSAHNIMHAVGAMLGLGVFNLILVLGPFLGMTGALTALFVAGAAVSITGVLLFAGVLLSIAEPGSMNLSPALYSDGLTAAATLSMSVGLAASGLLFLIGDYYLGRIFYRGTLRYLNFHLRLRKEER